MNARDFGRRVDSEIAAPLRAPTPALDELHRARLTAAIEDALDEVDRDDEQTSTEPVSARGTAWRVGLSTLGIAAAVVAAVVLFRGPRATQAPRVPVARAAQPAMLPLLVPFGAGDAAAAPSSTLLALAGQRVRATVGTRVRLTLVGPGRVSVVPAPRAGDFELALDRGRLLVDYDGHAGGTLRVRSPGAITTVVGTLFAVEATGSGTRVAVARGRVRTDNRVGQAWQVAAGESWTSADGRLVAISDELAAALVRHEAGWTANEPTTRALPSAGPAGRAKAPIDLEALYADAEAAMRARSIAEARRMLETIAGRDPHGPLGEAALLDLARLALADGDRAEARRALGRLPGRLSNPALGETAQHLRCRAQRTGDADDSCDL